MPDAKPKITPTVPDLALTTLLLDDVQPRDITVRDAPPNHPCHAIVERGNRQIPVPQNPDLTSCIISAMLAHHPSNWTLNGNRIPAR